MRYAVGVWVGLVPSLMFGATLQVDDDASHCLTEHRSISAAIASSMPGDVVEVCPGRYEESLTIPHALTIRGRGPSLERRTGDPATETVLIRMGHSASGMLITASGVRIEGFTFGSGEKETSGLPRILTLSSVSGTAIIGNAFLGSWTGIHLFNQDRTRPARVEGNRFFDCFTALAAFVRGASISRNDVTRWANGLHVVDSEDVTVANNVAREAGFGSVAIIVQDSVRIRVTNNQISRSQALGISVFGSSQVAVEGNRLHDLLATSSGIRLAETHSSRVVNNRLVGGGPPGGEVSREWGVFIQQSNNVDVWGNVVDRFGDGIKLERSSRNRIVANRVARSGRDGIRLDSNSLYNLLVFNDVRLSGEHDAHDLAPESNWWLANRCVTDNPVGTICR